ncbi:TonB-dependent receptor plug domain-containing protein [Porifericola rhodea]|uniref:TonB-dependent receptor plug domain-containing protein n=1 Tax=Porifericola rhodea TaxID=930972 RepID=UPI002665E306|nr:TonB-dependent receptor plug domain-containing protein [Porifericola rhodea]WKN32323.1 TonB-dependent receptor plug domain-containing protein [Porifericola rhodea]
MKKYKISLLACLVLFFGLSAFIWKDDPIQGLIDTIKNKLETYRVNYNSEKLYLHLDKSQYVAGETVWLKAYLVEAATNQPLPQDALLYVDILNEEGESIKQIKLAAQDGKAEASISLPDTLESGAYQLISYTDWMRNFDDAQFFRKNIRVWQARAEPSLGTTISDKYTSQLADLQFFPEGGDWVAGIHTRLAFKAIDKQGKSVDARGEIVDAEGNSILSFETTHEGMGAVEFIPEAGKNYTAVVSLADGSQEKYVLPQVKNQGYGLRVKEYADAEFIQVNIHTKGEGASPLLLAVVGNDKLLHTEKVMLEGESQIVKLAKNDLPAGINRITLSDTQGQPLAERLVFLHPEKQLQLKISTHEPDYLQREQVKLSIETFDAEGKPVAANLSMAVTDEELVPEDQEKRSLNAHLLLSSELKGHIEQPDYYFKDINAEKKEALSLVMMTHGWRRFNWYEELPQITQNRKNALSVDGKLEKDNGTPVENGEVILYVKDQPDIFLVEETDKNGYFSFEGFDYYDSVEFVIQGTTAKGRRDVKVLMDEAGFVPQWSEEAESVYADELVASTEKFVSRSANQASVEQSMQVGLKEMLLKEIVVQERRQEIVEPFRLHTRADVVIDASTLPVASSGNILESLQGRIPGVNILRSGMYDYRASIRGGGAPLYLIDGMPVDASALSTINQFDLDRVEVLKGPSAAIYGGRGGNGVIALYTKRGGPQYEEVEPSDHIILHSQRGYHKAREFYSPKYTADGKADLPDYRTTLYWNPNIQTKEDGKAMVSFYTADRNTSYRVLVNGLTNEGLAGSTAYSFKVEKPEEVSP